MFFFKKRSSFLILSSIAMVFTTIIAHLAYFYASTPILRQIKIEPLFGTYLELQFYLPRYQSSWTIKSEFLKELNRLSKIFNYYDSHSELSQINQKAAKSEIAISSELEHVIQTSLEWAKKSNGLFDPTIAPLSHLWKVKNKNLKWQPTKRLIQDTQQQVDYKNITLKNGLIRFLHPKLQINLDANAKGFIIDKGIEYLKSQGISSALLNIGGNVYALGTPVHRECWQLGIENPRPHQIPNSILSIVGLKNQAMAISGDYHQYRFDKHNQRIHHLIDPKTGYPSERSISVSVIANNALIADSLSTMLFLLGPDKGIRFIESVDNVEAMIIYQDKHKKQIALVQSNQFPPVSLTKGLAKKDASCSQLNSRLSHV